MEKFLRSAIEQIITIIKTGYHEAVNHSFQLVFCQEEPDFPDVTESPKTYLSNYHIFQIFRGKIVNTLKYKQSYLIFDSIPDRKKMQFL